MNSFADHLITIRKDSDGRVWWGHAPFISEQGPYPSMSVAMRNRAAYCMEIGFPDAYGALDMRDVDSVRLGQISREAHEFQRKMVGRQKEPHGEWGQCGQIGLIECNNLKARGCFVALGVHLLSGEHMLPDESDVVTSLPDGHEIMEPSDTLRFTIEYPLTIPRECVYVNRPSAPWTKQAVVDQVIYSYQETYHQDALSPETVEPFGIWNHPLGDLVLEGAARQEDGSWLLVVDR